MKKLAEKLKANNKKHIKIMLVIWLAITLGVWVITGFESIILSILLGLIYVGYYLLTLAGYNPIIEGLKSIWRIGEKVE